MHDSRRMTMQVWIILQRSHLLKIGFFLFTAVRHGGVAESTTLIFCMCQVEVSKTWDQDPLRKITDYWQLCTIRSTVLFSNIFGSAK
jgi:hypothetical protein